MYIAFGKHIASYLFISIECVWLCIETVNKSHFVHTYVSRWTKSNISLPVRWMWFYGDSVRTTITLLRYADNSTTITKIVSIHCIKIIIDLPSGYWLPYKLCCMPRCGLLGVHTIMYSIRGHFDHLHILHNLNHKWFCIVLQYWCQ